MVPDTTPATARRFGRYAREMRALARRTAALRAPASLRERKDRLAAFMGAVAKDLARLEAAAARNDESAAGTAIENVNGHSRGLDESERELSRELNEAVGAS